MTSAAHAERRPSLLLVALGSLAWLAAIAWLRPLMLPDEGRYVGAAWEMIYSGDWLTPTLDGLPFFHKPPLFYWITAAAMSLGGVNEWAGRAAPLLGAWLAVMSLLALARRWVDGRQAWLTAVVLLVQPLFYIGAQYANLDMLVAGCITATIAALAHAALNMAQSLPYRRTLALAYGLAALGVLAKGLIGIVLPGLVITVWLLLLRRWRDWLRLLWLPGMVLFLLVAAPWFLAMQARFPDFLNYFFVVQHFKRFSLAGFNNVQPFWFYPVVLLVFSAPGLAWLYRSVRWGRLSDPAQGPIRLLMWVWMLCVVVFFSLPKSKIVGYVLPAVPPLAYLMADGLRSLGEPSSRQTRWWWFSVGVSALVSVVAVIAISLVPQRSTRLLSEALRSQRQAGDSVMMLKRYAYDLTFYARTTAAASVVDEWDSPGIDARDDWRKELADARRFASPQAAQSLIKPSQVVERLCQHGVTWVVGRPSDADQYPVLKVARLAYTDRDTALWQVDLRRPEVMSSLRCAKKPNDD
jgi:4-amino-4-deoxy-L-arabinose transferase-like glycosyltransferase